MAYPSRSLLPNFNTFGELLRHLRRRARLTQRDLGLAVGYSEAHITRLEKGQRLPDLTTVRGLFIEALGLEHEPELSACLVELAIKARRESAAQASYKSVSVTALLPKPTNLLAQLARFIGREREIHDLQHLLGENRLVTLIGAGGVGKTRLAHQVATGLSDANTFAGGVWWAELAALTDGALVPQTVAAALRLVEQPEHNLLAVIANCFAARPALLILDNCEHLIDACAGLAEHLLLHCPALRILVTSRETMRLAGEVVYRVPSLTIPPLSNDHVDPNRYESVQLFVERARAAQPAFALTGNQVAGVMQVCRRLDGIPLAIELAAARLNMLTLEQIAARLNHDFQLLINHSRAVLPRHQTLKATLDWSHALLSEPERALFRSLSVFTGAFSLEAVEAVCTGSLDEGGLQDAALTRLMQLTNKSLVVALHDDQRVRYRLLEPIRQYAHEDLVTAGELDVTCERHLDYFLDLAEAIEPQPHLQMSASKDRLDRLQREYDNLRSALGWAIEHRKTDKALRLSSALSPFWQIHGHWSEGRSWLEQGLSLSHDLDSVPAHPEWVAEALFQAGNLAWRQCDYVAARNHMEEALEIYCELKSQVSRVVVLSRLGGVIFEQGDYISAQAIYEQGLALSRQLGNRRAIADALFIVALVTFNRGDWAAARQLCAESLVLHGEVGDEYGMSYALNLMGQILCAQGQYGAAQTFYEDCLALRRELGDKRGIAATLGDLADMRTSLDDLDGAQKLYLESLNLFHDLGSDRGVAKALSGLARLAICEGHVQFAAKLLGAVNAALTKINASLNEPDHSEMGRTIATLHSQLDEASFNIAWTEGQAMTLQHAVEAAFSTL